MRLDRVQVAVRPRGILECLDLALLVCARWPLGLLVAAAVGVVPMILLNRLIFAGAEGDNALPLLGIVTALEMPWAAAPLTLYLGQVMFAERFDLSSLRHCLRAFGGAIGPQFLFQTLFRGLAFVTCVGGPVWLVLAYFMGPVIFLERGRWTATSGRSVALCQTEMGRIPLLLSTPCCSAPAGSWSARCSGRSRRCGRGRRLARCSKPPSIPSPRMARRRWPPSRPSSRGRARSPSGWPPRP